MARSWLPPLFAPGPFAYSAAPPPTPTTSTSVASCRQSPPADLLPLGLLPVIDCMSPPCVSLYFSARRFFPRHAALKSVPNRFPENCLEQMHSPIGRDQV